VQEVSKKQTGFDTCIKKWLST